MTRDDARARVAKGATLLDDKRPGWAARIDTGVLDLENPCLCVLGQIFGSYDAIVVLTEDGSGGAIRVRSQQA